MKFKRYEWRIIGRVLLLFLTLSAAAFFLIKGWYPYLLVMLPIVISQVIELCRFQQKAHKELEQFVEAIEYRDFSRFFNVKKAPSHLQPLREGFNRINTTFKLISKEKETQYQYLQKILELVDTGILSYEETTGEVGWMNESLKKMLQLPYLKNISSLTKRDTQLHAEITAIRPGESRIVTAQQERMAFKILLSATAFQTDGNTYKLIAFQNVNDALDETESKAWEKLLSVLTHEIMNSIAPISSLAETLQNRLQHPAADLSSDRGDLEIGMETIRKRSEGLLKFAETYRNLSRITTPNRSKVYVRDIFENLLQLMQPTLEQKQIELETILKDTSLSLEADTSLMEQVLINLVVNAIDAVKEKASPKISLSAYISQNNKTVLTITDNGCGIASDLLDKIFIPFFSTKKNGSGIGLSLCKQIMLLHKGTITVQSREGEGAVFFLQF